MIRVVDYGVGNIQAFLNLFKRLGFDAQRAATPEALLEATRLILPGVGHFDHAMQRLNDSGMRPLLDKLVLEEKVPVVGVCVGMQMLAQGSEEGSLPGLNWLPGQVRAFANHPRSADLPMPHMGWNNLEICENAPLFDEGFDGAPQFYFLHSYYFEVFIDFESESLSFNFSIGFAGCNFVPDGNTVRFPPRFFCS